MRDSVDNLLSWMRQAPRTIDWNALVAYDRTKTNTVLLQEYIARFSTSSYFPPFNGTVDSTPSELEWIYDFIVDAPRLSFENAVITSSMAKLTMRIMGGAQITIASEAGRSPAVIRVAEYDALQGPKLTMDIDLLIATGAVDSAGKVQLDLGLGKKPLLYYAPTLNQREKGGKFMLGKLQTLGPDIKIFMLNQISVPPGNFLKPWKFELRTHAEPGAKMARAANAGEGAVLLFITMEGEKNGTLPATDEDLKFLIPAGEYSAVVLMGQRFLFSRILAEGLSRMSPNTGITCELTGPEQGFAEGIRITKGSCVMPEIRIAQLPSLKDLQVTSFSVPLTAGFELIKKQNTDHLQITWSSSTQMGCKVSSIGGPSINGTLGAAWKIEQAFVFELEGLSGELKLVPVLASKFERVKVTPGTYAGEPDIGPHFAEIANALESRLATSFFSQIEKFTSAVAEIDIFVLNSLLFSGTNIVHFKSGQLPGDLAMFGELAPGLTRFSVTPLEPLIGQGTTLSFRTTPAMTGLTWKVENVTGSTGSAGNIDANGLYTAPVTSDINGLFKRVRVTATKAAYSSSALATVLVRDIQVTPFIQICNASTAGQAPLTRELAAGSLKGGSLNWDIVTTIGSRVVPSTVEEGDHTFQAGVKVDKTMFSVDEVIATDSAGRKGSSWVLVIHGMPNAKIVEQEDATLPDGQVQLLMDLGEGPIDPGDGPKYELKWTRLLGGGNVNEATGVYTIDPTSAFRFALITAEIPAPMPIYPTYNAYVILPLPLLDLPTLRTALSTSDRYFKTAREQGIDKAQKILNSDQ